MPRTTLWLFAEEQPLFLSIDPQLLRGFPHDIVKESPDHLETPEQTNFRLGLLREHPSSGLRRLAQRVDDAGAGMAAIHPDMQDLAADDLQTLFSAMGARGMTLLIAIALEHCTSAEDLRALARLTAVRHAMLRSNAEFFASAQHSSPAI